MVEIADDDNGVDEEARRGTAGAPSVGASTLQDEDSVLEAHVKEEPRDDDEEVFLAPGSRSSKPLFLPPDDDNEDEDEKLQGKPKLRVSYTGFS